MIELKNSIKIFLLDRRNIKWVFRGTTIPQFIPHPNIRVKSEYLQSGGSA